MELLENSNKTAKIELENILTKKELDSLADLPFRTLSNEYEVTLPLEKFCHSLHAKNLENGKTVPLIESKTDVYSVHTKDSLVREIEEICNTTPLRQFFLQLLPTNPDYSASKKIEEFYQVIQRVKENFGNSIKIYADPQGVCYNKDLKWGIYDGQEISVLKTMDALVESTQAFVEAGINGIITMGRLHHEVKVVKDVINKLNPDVKLMSFSTNSETSNAYIQETMYNPALAITGQKILVGNKNEMILRALLDVIEGTDIILQKPIESFHLTEYLLSLAKGEVQVETFLDRPEVQELIRRNKLEEDIYNNMGTLKHNLKQVKLGGYEVSGTFMIFKMLENMDLSRNLVYNLSSELYRSFMASSAELGEIIISRNAKWFALANKEFGREG